MIKTIKQLQQQAHDLIYTISSNQTQAQSLSELKDDIKIACFGYFLKGVFMGIISFMLFSLLTN